MPALKSSMKSDVTSMQLEEREEAEHSLAAWMAVQTAAIRGGPLGSGNKGTSLPVVELSYTP
jgi:hypothetical protein